MGDAVLFSHRSEAAEWDLTVLDAGGVCLWVCESQDPTDSPPCTIVGPFIFVFNIKEILQKNYTGGCKFNL